MAVHTLSRCLRTTPTSSSASLLLSRPSTRLAASQISSLVRRPTLRVQSAQYSSSRGENGSQSPNGQTSVNTSTDNAQQAKSPTESRPSAAAAKSQPNSETDTFDLIFKKLAIGSQDAANTTRSMKELSSSRSASPTRRPFIPDRDPASLSRAVGLSSETDNYRAPLRRVELKLGPSLGRQVHVEPDKGVDLAAAIRNLQIGCAVNRIRGQANYQRFHVRRGQRRKDQKRERWKKLFKFSFDKTVAKIQRMRAQGW
jgi:small subunit ribosomal protein MRP21